MTILSYLASLLRADLWYIFYGRWSMMGKIMATSFIISLISIATAVGSRSGSNERGQISKEEVKIIIYQQGKKTSLGSKRKWENGVGKMGSHLYMSGKWGRIFIIDK